LLLITLSGTGCYVWHTDHVAPQAVLDTRHPEWLRVTRADGSLVELQHPALQGDTLVGTEAGKREDSVADTRGTPQGHEVRIPLRDVKKTETSRRDVGTTLLFFAGAAVVALGALALGFHCTQDGCE
jgi:hypothetical protein